MALGLTFRMRSSPFTASLLTALIPRTLPPARGPFHITCSGSLSRELERKGCGQAWQCCHGRGSEDQGAGTGAGAESHGLLPRVCTHGGDCACFLHGRLSQGRNTVVRSTVLELGAGDVVVEGDVRTSPHCGHLGVDTDCP